MGQVDKATVETFRKDGVVVLRGVVDEAWRARLADAIESNMADPGPHGKNHADDDAGAYFGDYVNWKRFPAFREVGDAGKLGAIAGALMGAKRVQLFHEHVLVKEPGNSSATPWHQDLPYYCLDGSQTVSIWVPLDPVSAEVCPHFLAGSHQGQTTYMPRRFKTLKPLEGDTSTYQPFPDIDEARDADRMRSFDLEPGDAIAFDYHTLHNAPPNQTGTRRRAVSFRYMGEDVRFVARPHELSPPFTEMGLALAMGDPMPEDWFPTVWQAPG